MLAREQESNSNLTPMRPIGDDRSYSRGPPSHIIFVHII